MCREHLIYPISLIFKLGSGISNSHIYSTPSTLHRSLLMVSIRFHWQTQFRKALSNLRRNHTIRHLVNCFNTHNASTAVTLFKAFSQFALRFARTKYQNRISISKTRNYRLVVPIEMSRKRSLAAAICRYLVGFIGPLERLNHQNVGAAFRPLIRSGLSLPFYQ
jgi:hypothetical protein